MKQIGFDKCYKIEPTSNWENIGFISADVSPDPTNYKIIQ